MPPWSLSWAEFGMNVPTCEPGEARPSIETSDTGGGSLAKARQEEDSGMSDRPLVQADTLLLPAKRVQARVPVVRERIPALETDRVALSSSPGSARSQAQSRPSVCAKLIGNLEYFLYRLDGTSFADTNMRTALRVIPVANFLPVLRDWRALDAPHAAGSWGIRLMRFAAGTIGAAGMTSLVFAASPHLAGILGAIGLAGVLTAAACDYITRPV
jgi:hypothetical protein